MRIGTQHLKFIDQGPRHSFLKTIARLDLAQQIRFFSSALLLGLVASFFLLQVGCKAGADKVVKGSDEAIIDQAANKTGQKTIQPEPTKSETGEKQRPARAEEPVQVEKANKSKLAGNKADARANPANPPAPPSPNRPKPGGGVGKKRGSVENKVSEVDEIKQAAMDIAKNIDTIIKIRICHVENEDEWWVTLFDDIGTVIDLKQYVWDRDSETLRPFLVQKRISRARFESQLTSTSPDRTCEVMDPPPKPAKKQEKGKTF